MLSSFFLAALLGVAAAAPAKSTTTAKPTSTATGKGSGQTPFTFPLPNGFPNLNASALTAVEHQAQGTLPNGTLPSKLAAGDVASFSVVAFNEIFEVAFFNSLINNITSNKQGFGPVVPTSSQVTANQLVEILQTIQAQEQLHATGINAILTNSGNKAIKPCEYIFPSTTLTQAIRFASTFTDVVLGALQAVQGGLSANGDGALVPLVGSVIGQEGEQDGYYRGLLGLNPSAQPFLTGGAGAFAYNFLIQNVIVPGSCPAVSQLDIPHFGALTLNTVPTTDNDQTLSFSFMNNGTNVNNLNLVYINGQNLPIVESLKNVQTKGKNVTFSVDFPYYDQFLEGLTLAAVVQGKGPFTSPADVAAATVYGPGVIEVN